MEIYEEKKDESDNMFSLFNQDNEQLEPNEDHQKILKNILSNFKNNRQIQQPKKLGASQNIQKTNNYSLRPNNPNIKINKETNADGTTTETRIEKLSKGIEKITKIRYDKNHKVTSSKVFYKNNNNNNNNNINNHNNHNNNINNNPNIFRAANGFSIETQIKDLPNGRKKEVKIIRDENNVIVDVQEDEIFDYNRNIQLPNYNMNRPRPDNYMGNNMNMNNNYSNIPLRPRNNNNYMGGMNQMNPMIPMNYNMMNNPGRNMNPFPMPMPMPMMYNPMAPFMMNPFPMNPYPYNEEIKMIDPRIFNSLPENEIEDSSKLPEDQRNCVICLGDFQDKEHIIRLPCLHVFHSDCVKSWLGSHNSCPTCKFELTFENLNAQLK